MGGGQEYPGGTMALMVPLGLVFAGLAFFGFPVAITVTAGGLPFWSWNLPHAFAFGVAVVIAYFLGQKYKDPSGLTWYGRFGETPGQMFLWCMVAFIPYIAATQIIPSHFPGIGVHNVPKDTPLYTYITEDRKCVDHPEYKDLCALPGLCQKIREGDLDWAKSICDKGEVIKDCEGERDVFHKAIANCMAKCDCDIEDDIFNPVGRTGPGVADFACIKNKGCNTRGGSPIGNCMQWNFARNPRWIEMHAGTGVIIFFLAPFQFVKQIRMSFDKNIHRWMGRLLVVLVIPNIFSLFVLASMGTFGIAACHPYIRAWRIFGLFAASIFVCLFSTAIYHVKNGNIPAHGEYMMRSYAMWFGIAYFRMIVPGVSAFFPIAYAGWGFVLSLFFGFGIPLGIAETYIRKSDRFITPSHGEPDKSDASGSLELIDASGS